LRRRAQATNYQYGSASETEILIGAPRGSGIPAILAGRYNPKAPNQMLAPLSTSPDANRPIADMRDLAPSLIPAAERFADEPRIMTAITWLLAIGFPLLRCSWLLNLFSISQRAFSADGLPPEREWKIVVKGSFR